MKVREAILLLCVVFAPVVTEAQVPVRDNEKKKQWQSMENGSWDFAPDWYYYFLHKGYSGAEMYWKWAGFKSGFRVRFKESKSNIKRIMPTRVISEETQRQKLEKVEEERRYVEELYKEELVREADRTVDLAYPAYKDEFNRMQDCITDGLLYCMTKSGGKLKPQVDDCLYPQDGRGLRTGERQAAASLRRSQRKDGGTRETDRQPLRRGRHTLLELKCIT